MRYSLWLTLLGILTTAVAIPVRAQDTRALGDDPAMRYYDFWEGTWHQLVGGRVDTTRTAFYVRRDVHPAAFVERWRLVIDSTTTLHATALRAWDKTTRRWMYTWISDNGLYQVWEGRQVGAHWYIYREFDVQGDRYLSRQAWIPNGPNRLVRTSERSDDGGRTWQTRFREEYERRTTSLQ
jgi:hypothetical protein